MGFSINKKKPSAILSNPTPNPTPNPNTKPNPKRTVASDWLFNIKNTLYNTLKP